MELDFTKLDGLVAAVIQDWKTGRVLMVGFMNEESFRKTVETGNAESLPVQKWVQVSDAGEAACLVNQHHRDHILQTDIGNFPVVDDFSLIRRHANHNLSNLIGLELMPL